MSEPMWAVVELMGHVKMAGLVSEEERFGTKLGRVDIPLPSDLSCPLCAGTGTIPELNTETTGHPTMPCTSPRCKEFMTTFFSGQSVYRITPCTEQVARSVASQSINPVHAFGPRAIEREEPTWGDIEDDEDDDENEDDEDDYDGPAEF